MSKSIKDQMAANSKAWHTADAATKKKLEAANQKLGAQVGGSYNPSTGTWSDSKGGSLYGSSTPTSGGGTTGTAPKPSGAGTTTPKPSQTTYYDPTGKQQTGYIIGGTTYKDAGGTQRIDQGSVVQTARGYYKLGANGSEFVGKTYQAPTTTSYGAPAGSTATTIKRGDQTINGYIKDNLTYDDKGQRVVAGDIVGDKYLMTEAGKGIDISKERAASVYNKDSELGIPTFGNAAGQVYNVDGKYYDARTGKLAGAGFIDLGDGRYYDTETGQTMTQEEARLVQRNAEIEAQMQAELEAQLAAQRAAEDEARLALEAAQQQGNQQLDEAAAQSEIAARQNMDNLALRAARQGDMGGIGQKQYGDAANANDKRLMEISLERRNLETSTQQQIAQLQAQGKMAEAQLISELGMKQLQLLIQEEDKLMAFKRDQELTDAKMFGTYKGQPTQATQEMNYNNAMKRLQLGIFSEQDAALLGIPPEQAKRFADMINITAQIDLEKAKQQLAEVTGVGGKATTTGNAAPAEGEYQSIMPEGYKPADRGIPQYINPVKAQMLDSLYQSTVRDPDLFKKAIENHIKSGQITWEEYEAWQNDRVQPKMGGGW